MKKRLFLALVVVLTGCRHEAIHEEVAETESSQQSEASLQSADVDSSDEVEEMAKIEPVTPEESPQISLQDVEGIYIHFEGDVMASAMVEQITIESDRFYVAWPHSDIISYCILSAKGDAQSLTLDLEYEPMYPGETADLSQEYLSFANDQGRQTLTVDGKSYYQVSQAEADQALDDWFSYQEDESSASEELGVYQELIDSWRQSLANFETDRSFPADERVNTLALNYVVNYDNSLDYALYDIDGNGTEELLMRVGSQIFEIYGTDGETVYPFFNDETLAERSKLTWYQPDQFLVAITGGAASNGWDLYEMADNGLGVDHIGRYFVSHYEDYEGIEQVGELGQAKVDSILYSNQEFPVEILDWQSL